MKTRKGFTLLEILVVAALVTLLSGIAMFSISTLYQRAQMNATRGEASQISKAESFAHIDIGFYPKFHFLDKSESEINDPAIVSLAALKSMQYTGAQMQAVTLAGIENTWNGPYWGISNKSDANMPIPVNDMGIAVSGGSFKKPVDPWGNEYVMYMLVKDPGYSSGGYSADANGVRPIITATEEPDYMCAIVSYGPNGHPGEDQDPDSPRTLLLPLNNETVITYWDTFQGYQDLNRTGSDDIILNF